MKAIDVLQKVAQSAEQVEKKTDKAESGVASFDESLGHLNMNTLATVAGVTTLVATFNKLTGAVKNFIQSSVRSFAQFEGLQKSLGVTIGDVNKGMTEFEQLKKYANETPYTVTGLADVASQLHAVGVGAEEAMEMLKRFGDVALGDSVKMSRIAQNYAQIMSVGKTSAIDTKQFAMMGLPIYDMFKKLGVQGNATAEQVKKAFIMMTEEGGKFYKGMEMGKDSLNVAFNQFNGQVQSLQATIGSLFGDEAKGILGFMTEAVKKIEAVVGKLNNHPLIKSLLGGVVLTAITTLAGVIVGALIPALMTLLATLNPIGATVGLVVGLITGLAGSFAMAGIETQLYAEKTDESVKKLKEQNKQLKIMYDMLDGHYNMTDASAESFSKLNSDVNFALGMTRRELADYQKNFDWQRDGGMTDDGFISTNIEDSPYYKELKKRLELLKQQQIGLQNINKTNLANFKTEEYLTEQVKKRKELLDDISRMQGDYLPKDEISKMQEDLDKLLALRKANYVAGTTVDLATIDMGGYQKTFRQVNKDYADKDVIDALIDALTKKIGQAQAKKINDNLSEWQKLMKKDFGFTDAENGYLVNGRTGVARFVANNQTDLQRTLRGNELLGSSGIGYGIGTLQDAMARTTKAYEQMYEKALNSFNDFIQSGLWDGTEDSIRDLTDAIKKYKQEVENARYGEVLGQLASDRDYNRLSKTERFYADIAKQYNLGDYNENKNNSQWMDNLRNVLSMSKTNRLEEAFNKGGYYGWGAQMTAEGVNKSFFGEQGSFESGMQGLGEVFVGEFSSTVVPQLVNQIGAKIDTSTAQGKAMKAGLQAMNNILGGMDAKQAIISAILSALFSGIEKDIADQTEANKLEAIREQLVEMNANIKDQLDYLHETQLALQSRFLNEKVSSGVLTRFNDGIVTPQGYISTHPDDYILAMKNPAQLAGGGNAKVQVIVNNNAGDVQATVSERDNGDMKQLFITISKKVASDVASGQNGWDSALSARDSRLKGRYIG